jgi:uncharacterized protein YicC (UPF0701 family)
MPKINFERLQNIIREEVAAFAQQPAKKVDVVSPTKTAAQEADVVSKITRGAGSMLSAISNFEELESESLKASIGSKIEDVKKILMQVVQNPYNYIDKTNPASASNVKSQVAQPQPRAALSPEVTPPVKKTTVKPQIKKV